MAVELQLGLALPTALIPNPIAINIPPLFDLNNLSHHSDDDESNASTKFCRSSISRRIMKQTMKTKKKRSFEDSSGSDCASTDTSPPPQNLRLVLWNKQPNDDDDRPSGDRTCNLTLIRNEDETTEGIVGWPPIRTYRKKQRGRDGGNGLYVKAQIEGVLITRKIDLNLHRSYRTLASAILFMFGRGHESVEGYNLTYQDKEGDWLLAVDIPWRTFLESVQRLKLMRRE